MLRWNILIPAILILSGYALMIQTVESSAGLTAKVVKIKGAPHVERDGKDVALTINAAVKQGDSIVTDGGESLVLELSSGDTIVISQLSRLKLDLKDGDVNITHDKGAVWAKVKKQTGGKDRSFKVNTPTAVAGVRGTAFSSTVESPDNAWFCVCEGLVEISRENTTVSARGGQAVKAMGAGAPGRPMPDAALLEQAHGSTEGCLRCHQGGYSRDGLY